MKKESKMRRNKTSYKKKYFLDIGSFDDDDDDDDENTIPHNSLIWQGDPNDTLSNWIIIIKGVNYTDHISATAAAAIEQES